jgi:hypothetical protein
MAGRPLDELVSWTFDGRGRIAGFEGVRQHNRIDWLSRLLLPGLDAGFAAALGTLSTDYREPLDEEVMHGPRSHACEGWDWAEVRGGGASLVAFTSGPGDGHYGVYRGLDRNGETTTLLIDFEYEGPVTAGGTLPTRCGMVERVARDRGQPRPKRGLPGS